MSELRKPQKPKTPKHQLSETQKRDLPIWCRGIMGGCVNCGGCV